MKKILLLEDDMALHETVKDFLESLEYEVISSFDGEDAGEKAYENNFDLLLLDVNVPKMSGFELLSEIRDRQNETPAIFITSLSGIADLESGYDSGCDDYIKKPFALKELQLRVETLLKREFYHNKSDEVTLPNGCSFDTGNDTLKQNGVLISLANKELQLLKLFLQHKNELVSHEVIENRLWGYDEESSESAVRTYIKHLRQILGKDTIVSIKKSGYKFIQK
ncbi:response regulator transcription factor [Sulfurimonas microaerophilic]|uniref:response regulator transcription factor n=1 Tax=Sulfurimonas microaerophilic TaxID=3058392 RepID=UPI0027155F12|nr:response regulator transcription factor [Sulfurimonas sp. hsl 1-7]